MPSTPATIDPVRVAYISAAQETARFLPVVREQAQIIRALRTQVEALSAITHQLEERILAIELGLYTRTPEMEKIPA